MEAVTAPPTLEELRRAARIDAARAEGHTIAEALPDIVPYHRDDLLFFEPLISRNDNNYHRGPSLTFLTLARRPNSNLNPNSLSFRECLYPELNIKLEIILLLRYVSNISL